MVWCGSGCHSFFRVWLESMIVGSRQWERWAEVRGSKKSRRNTEEGHLIEPGDGLRGESSGMLPGRGDIWAGRWRISTGEGMGVGASGRKHSKQKPRSEFVFLWLGQAQGGRRKGWQSKNTRDLEGGGREWALLWRQWGASEEFEQGSD